MVMPVPLLLAFVPPPPPHAETARRLVATAPIRAADLRALAVDTTWSSDEIPARHVPGRVFEWVVSAWLPGKARPGVGCVRLLRTWPGPVVRPVDHPTS